MPSGKLLNKDAVINELHLPIDLTLKFTILDQLPFDMIIGRGDILKYNLMDTVVMHTTSTPVLIAAHHSQIELSTNGNSKPSSKSVLGQNKPVDYHSNSPPSSCASTTLRVKPSQTVKPLTVENNISLDVKDSAESRPIQSKHPPLTGVAKSKTKCSNQSNNRVIINVENEAHQAKSLSLSSSPTVSDLPASTEIAKPCTSDKVVTGGNTFRKSKKSSIKSTQSKLLNTAASVDACAIGINAPESRSIMSDLGGSVYLPWVNCPQSNLSYTDRNAPLHSDGDTRRLWRVPTLGTTGRVYYVCAGGRSRKR